MNNKCIQLLLIASLLVPNCVAFAEENLTNQIDKISPMAGQLVRYEWAEIDFSKHVAVSNKLGTFQSWLKPFIQDKYLPLDSELPRIHFHTPDTCDAMRLDYKRDGMAISIYQTKGAALIVMRGGDAVIHDLSMRESVVSTVNRIFHTVLAPVGDELDITTTSAGYCIGGIKPSSKVGNTNKVSSASTNEASSRTRTVVRPVRPARPSSLGVSLWWANGSEVAYFGTKAPSSDSSIVYQPARMEDLKFNQSWFVSRSRFRDVDSITPKASN